MYRSKKTIMFHCKKNTLKKTPITPESLRFLVLFMLMLIALQIFALLLASNIVRTDIMLSATPQPLMPVIKEQDTWLGRQNVTLMYNPSIKIPIIPRFRTTPWN